MLCVPLTSVNVVFKITANFESVTDINNTSIALSLFISAIAISLMPVAFEMSVSPMVKVPSPLLVTT